MRWTPFQLHSALAAAAGVAGLLGTHLFAREPADRVAAFVGVSASIFSGVLSLSLKKRAVEKSLERALLVLGVVFGVRLLLVLVGLLWVVSQRWGTVAFVLGFFGVYFALQWIEVSYVLAESKRHGDGG